MEAIILDTDFSSIKVVDSFESMIWTDRYDEAGDFEIYVSANSDLMTYAKQDRYLFMRESEHLMIIEGTEISSDTEDGNKLIITGRSLESILDRRIVWNQTNLNGNLQNGIESLLNSAIINPDNADRKISNFIFNPSTDTYITGLTIDAQYTGDNLYEVITNLCKANDLGFKITLNSSNQFVFELYYGTNRSYDQSINPYVIFSQNFENIINSDYLENKKTFKNVTLVAGEGEGASRKTTTVGSGSGLERRELFTDARDISSNVDGGTLTDEQYYAKLTQRGTENLAENATIKTFDGEVETTKMFVYGRDFFLGDIVQVVNDYGTESKSRVTEMIMSQDTGGYTAYPSFTIIEDDNEED